MPDGHVPLRQAGERVGRKDLADESDVLVGAENAVVVDDDAAAFLPAVLQGVQTVVRRMPDVGFLRA